MEIACHQIPRNLPQCQFMNVEHDGAWCCVFEDDRAATADERFCFVSGLARGIHATMEFSLFSLKVYARTISTVTFRGVPASSLGYAVYVPRILHLRHDRGGGVILWYGMELGAQSRWLAEGNGGTTKN